MAPPANQSVNWVDLGFKFLSILIIPIMAMGISVYTDVSVQKERVAQAQHRLDENQQQIEAITSRVNQVAITATDTNAQIRELRTILEFIRERIAADTRSGVRQ